MLRIARGLRLRFKYCSFSHSQADFTKRIDLKRGSKVLERGHSVVASVVSDDSKVKKAGKRVTKDERRAMVESYVMKYKAMNNGKFPTPSSTVQQVGGSYYVIKGILQELEYRSKTSHINPMHENALEKEATAVNRVPADVASGSISHLKRKAFSGKVVEPKKTVDVDDVKSDYSDVKSVGAEEVPRSSTSLRPTFSDMVIKAPTTEAVKLKTTRDDDVADPGDSMFMGVAAEEEPWASASLKKTLAEEVVKPKSTLQGDSSSSIANQKHEPEAESEEVAVHLHSVKREHDVKELLPSKGSHPQIQQHKPSAESDKLAMGSSGKQTDDDELPKQQSMWGNLKSLADGIMKIWRGL